MCNNVMLVEVVLMKLCHYSCLNCPIRVETISCKVPLIPKGHAFSTQFSDLDSGTLVHVNDSINVTCNGGYYIRGSSPTMKCQEDGNWTTIPKCTSEFMMIQTLQ